MKTDDLFRLSLDGTSLFRCRRVQLEMTMADLRRRSGVSLNAIRRLENGEGVRQETLQRLAPHLQLTHLEANLLLLRQEECYEEKRAREARLLSQPQEEER
jgi:transcriptional regulator with XRE-family HTH domain